MLTDLIKQIKQKSEPIKIISNYDTLSKQGYVFERLWDLVIKFGCCELFPNTEYKHIDGNINTGTLEYITSIQKYITESNIISGNSGGCSDITLYNPEKNKYIFISCKYFTKSDDIKNISKYDIQNIVSVINSNKEIYQNYEIFLFVNDKHNVLKRVKKANKSSRHITKYMIESNILDMNDLTKYYKFLRKELKKYNMHEYDRIFGHGKTNLIMRFHQQLICNKTLKLISEGQKQLLLGGKPRCGKTYICGGIIVRLKENRDIFNVLIITPAPTETVPQFIEDLFEKHKEFNDCNIIHIDSSKKIKNLKKLLGDKNIIITSKQLLQQYVKDKRLKLPKINMIFFDENHFSGTTDISKEILYTYSTISTIKMYITATYNKPLKEWCIPKECQMYWDIEDEQFCKARNIDKLIDKHGDEVKCVITTMKKDGLSKDNIFGLYDNYPDLHLITNMFDPYRYEVIKDEIMNSKYGFSFDVLFSFGNKKKKNFRYSNSVEKILRYISGSYKEIDFKDGDKSILGRIESMCEKNESRKPFTQIWFLPTMNGINEISKCLKELIMKDSVLSTYDVMIVNSRVEDKVTNIKAEINKNEKIAKETGKSGLIILAGNMLSLGITLKLCDVVMLLNNTLSADRVMQMMYRCMSESMNGDKKFGFVVDLNISRVIHSCISYHIYKKDMNIEDKIDYLIKGHLINIDADLFDNKKIDSDKIITKLLNIWKSDPINNLKTMLKQIENDIIELKSEDQKILNAYFIKSSGKTVDIEMLLKDNDDEKQSIKCGISNDDLEDKKKVKENKELEKKISFTKDVLPFIIPLACILTMSDKNKDFLKMLNTIKEDKELLEIFNDQSMIWWNKKGIIDLVKSLVTKYIDKNSIAYNVSVNFKLSLQSLIDKPKELLGLIDSCLKPKHEEKKKFGEVFTPMKLVNEMLDELDKYYKKEHNKSIFSEKSFTWFDPANGMGNFPIAIYIRLMNGLKDNILNKTERKKHILENMLYMSELNKKNVYICKQIFDINDEYKLNLYNGDSLELNTNKKWRIDKFDVIVGNPPYNKNFNKSLKNGYAKPLYNEFIETFIEKSKYLQFIVPSRWFIGGRGLEKFKNNMIKRKDIIYIKHYVNASDIFGNNVLIKGGVNHFLKCNTHNGLCNFNGKNITLGKYDIIVQNPEYHDLINNIMKHNSLTNIYCSKGCYGISLTNKYLHDTNNDKNDILCYVSKQKGFKKYINIKHVPKYKKTYKVITSTASTANYDCFGNIIIANEDEIHSESYISFKVSSKSEAESLFSYLKCRLPNLLLKIRKITHNISSDTCKWIPLPKLDRVWTDKEVYKHFKLSNEQIKLVKNAKIVGYKDIISSSAADKKDTPKKKSIKKAKKNKSIKK